MIVGMRGILDSTMQQHSLDQAALSTSMGRHDFNVEMASGVRREYIRQSMDRMSDRDLFVDAGLLA